MLLLLGNLEAKLSNLYHLKFSILFPFARLHTHRAIFCSHSGALPFALAGSLMYLDWHSGHRETLDPLDR